MNNFGSLQSLVDSLLLEIYGSKNENLDSDQTSECSTIYKLNSNKDNWKYTTDILKKCSLEILLSTVASLKLELKIIGSYLIKHLMNRDRILRKRQFLCNLITTQLIVLSKKSGESGEMKFSLPSPLQMMQENLLTTTSSTTTMGLPTSTSDFNQWLHAMKMVARLPGGMPQEFRKKLWLALSDKHIQTRKINWNQEQIKCLSEQWRADDEELGVQIVKDLHRTGSSLCSGPTGSLNQAKLKRVLLGYARWNPEVGYCQGFNMLGAIILQVMDRNEADSIKVMMLLVEGVLPPGYFSGSLGGLQADMAVFRELLASRLPKLAKHLQRLQGSSVEGTFEPPLTNVFTMQWFLTLFCTCLPINCVLRVWDLILIEGSDVLLRTALAIWGLLEERITNAKSADDFYCKMGILSGELLNGNLIDSNGLVQKVVDLGPIADLQKLRDKHLYNISPWRDKKGLKLFYSDDEGESDDDSRLAVTTAWGVRMGRLPPIRNVTDNRDRLALDISLLKQQYTKLRERQRQAHIILTAACARQSSNTTGPTMQMNQFLMGRNAILSKSRRIGPPLGAVPPARKLSCPVNKPLKLSTKAVKDGETLHWKDTDACKKRKNSLKWKDVKTESIVVQDDNVPPIESDYRDIKSLSTTSSLSNLSENPKSSPSNKSRQRSESSSYSEESDANSSTSTSLCDDENLKHSQSSSVEQSPLKKKISPEIEVPEGNKNEDIQKYIDNIKETFLESQYEDIRIDEFLSQKSDPSTELEGAITVEYIEIPDRSSNDSSTNLLIDLHSENVPVEIDDKYQFQQNTSFITTNINENFIESSDILSGSDVVVDIISELSINKLCVNQNVIETNIINENLLNYVDVEKLKNNSYKYKYKDDIVVDNEPKILEDQTQSKQQIEIQVMNPNEININLLLSDENIKSPCYNNISSISQLSPIPDITKYISMSSISPIRTPQSSSTSNIDYIDYSIDSANPTNNIKIPNDPRTSNKLEKINIFDVSDEGVTNQLFERMNVERPTRLDIPGLYESDTKTNSSMRDYSESFKNENNNIKSDNNNISTLNQLFNSTFTLELPLKITEQSNSTSILPSCTDISSITAEKSPLIHNKKLFIDYKNEEINMNNENSFDTNSIKQDAIISEFSYYSNERTNFLKEKSISLDEPTKDKIYFKPTSCPEPRNETISSKSSDRVLKIIQENSLILHRILRKNSTKSDESDSLFENISKIMESPVQEITKEFTEKSEMNLKSTNLDFTDSITYEGGDTSQSITSLSNTSVLPSEVEKNVISMTTKIESDDEEIKTNSNFVDTPETNKTLSATLSSIENTIKSINILCDNKNPTENQIKYKSFDENVTNVNISHDIIDIKKCENDIEYNNDKKINYPIINIVDSSLTSSHNEITDINVSDKNSKSFIRLGRDSKREPSPRRRRLDELEENANKTKRNVSPSFYNITDLSPYKTQTLDRLLEDKQKINNNFNIKNDKLDDYSFSSRSPYRQQLPSPQESIYEKSSASTDKKTTIDNDIDTYFSSNTTYINRGPPEKPKIRMTTVTSTFYDRYLSQKKEQSAKLDKSPSSPIITKAYLDSLKPFPDRIIKSAENSPSRLKYESSNIIVPPTSFDEINKDNKSLFNIDYHHVKSCDNILVKLGKEVKTDITLTTKASTLNNSSFSSLPIKQRQPTEIGIKLGLYKTDSHHES